MLKNIYKKTLARLFLERFFPPFHVNTAIRHRLACDIEKATNTCLFDQWWCIFGKICNWWFWLFFIFLSDLLAALASRKEGWDTNQIKVLFLKTAPSLRNRRGRIPKLYLQLGKVLSERLKNDHQKNEIVEGESFNFGLWSTERNVSSFWPTRCCWTAALTRPSQHMPILRVDGNHPQQHLGSY